MPTKNKAQSAIDQAKSPTVEEDDKFAKTGGLVMTPETGENAKQRGEDEEGAAEAESEPDPKSIHLPDIAPNWVSLPEDEIKSQLLELTRWLRDRGAVVRGPSRDSDSEYIYEWEYQKQNPITIRGVADDPLSALRECAQQAYHRRHEV